MFAVRVTKRVVSCLLLIMSMMTGLQAASAQKQVNEQAFVTYADGTLTFDYGVKPSSGQVFDLNQAANDPAWKSLNPQVTKVVFTTNFSKARPTSLSYWFVDCKDLNDIEGIENLNTSKVDHFFYTFLNCEKLTTIDVTHFDTSNAIILAGLFAGCKSLASIDVSHFDTRKAQWTYLMFQGCESLTTLDLRNFDTQNVNYTNSMFAGCSHLKNLYISDKFDLSKVPEEHSVLMFSGCESIEGAVPYDPDFNSDEKKRDEKQFANYKTGYCQKVVGTMGDELVGAAGEPLRVCDLQLKDKVKLNITDSEVVGAAKASYSRAVTSDWGTICLPFAVDVADEANDCYFYPFEKIELGKGRIPVKRMTSGVVGAGVPMFVKRKDRTQDAIHVVGKQGDNDLVGLVSAPVNAAVGNRLVGTFDAMVAPSGAYFIAKDRFRLVADYVGKDNTQGVKVYGYRAYIVAGGTVAAKPSSLDIEESEAPTGIGDVENDADASVAYYDVQGRKLSEPCKGLNIVRTGALVRKVVIK